MKKPFLTMFIMAIGMIAGAQTLDTIALKIYCVDVEYSSTAPFIIEPTITEEWLALSESDTFNNKPAQGIGTEVIVESGIINMHPGLPWSIQYLGDTVYGYEIMYVPENEGTDSTYMYVLKYYVDINLYSRPRICMVTTDEQSGVKQILLDSSYLNPEDSVVLERQVLGGWTLIEPDVDSTVILDSNYPDGQALTYRLRSTAVDCESEPITTMNLSANQAIEPNEVNLSWTEYVSNEDDVLDGYYVLKINGTDIDTVAEVPIGNTTLNGVTWQAGDKFRVEAYKSACAVNPYGNKQSDVLAIRSNVKDPNVTSVGDMDEQVGIRMPNPYTGLDLTLNRPMDVEVYTANGQMVKSYPRTDRVSDSDLMSGLYIVTLRDDRTVISRKLVVGH